MIDRGIGVDGEDWVGEEGLVVIGKVNEVEVVLEVRLKGVVLLGSIFGGKCLCGIE